MGNYKTIDAMDLVNGARKMLAEKWGYIWGTAGDLWTEAKQKALVQKYNGDPERYSDYKLGAEYGRKWIGHKVTDCSGLFKRIFKDHGSDIFHGSDTMWKSWCANKGDLRNGRRTDGKELKPGTAVFTYNKKTGKRGHVGCYIGNGKVIEAEGTIKGVIEGPITNSKWVEWGELKNVNYGMTVETPVIEIPVEEHDPQIVLTYPTLRQGAKGDLVVQLQDLLAKDGSSLVVDGIFGSGTRSAVQAFQRRYGLEVDGVVGPKTWKKLLEVAGNIKTTEGEKEKLVTLIIPDLKEKEAQELKQKYPRATIAFE